MTAADLWREAESRLAAWRSSVQVFGVNSEAVQRAWVAFDEAAQEWARAVTAHAAGDA